jgi:MazG family protein
MPHLVEECYEVLDALADLDGSDRSRSHLEEELGDLLFQIVFHARLASEEGWFDLAAVARGVHNKLVQRHPHVFGDVEVANPEEVVTNWEAIKKAEKGRTSVTQGIPAALPALMLTTKLARKARTVGVESTATPHEIAVALASLTAWVADSDEPQADDPLSGNAEDLSRSVGELLFAVATLAQRAGVDAELALRHRALSLRDEVRAAEGVPNQEFHLR